MDKPKHECHPTYVPHPDYPGGEYGSYVYFTYRPCPACEWEKNKADEDERQRRIQENE